jgi:hypothetical protein
LRIGTVGGEQFGGWLDEVAFYNKMLPPERIQLHALRAISEF